MMKFKLQAILRSVFLLLALLPAILSAHNFEVNGIFYNINGTNATVTYKGSSYNTFSNEYSGSVSIPATVAYKGTTYTVSSIGDYALAGCTSVTSVIIPNSVTSIGSGAFSGCSGMTSVTIPNTITSIGNSAFSGCSGMTNVTIPNTITSISDYTFYNCTGLTSMTIPNSVTSVGNSAFRDCTGLTSVTIPNSIISIGSNTFYGCAGLTRVTIPYSVSSIGQSAFSGCTALKTLNYNAVSCADFTYSDKHQFYNTSISTINIGNSVQKIPKYFAQNLSKISNITIPNSVTSIGGAAFSGCTGLTSVTIPNSVTSIGGAAFSGCTGLTSVTIPNSVTSIGSYTFRKCSSLISVSIPNTVTTIADFTFAECSSMPFIIIPNSVVSIGEQAFSDCGGLISVTIPNSVTYIGEKAFVNCSALTSLTIGTSVSTIDYDAFRGCTSLETLNYNAISCNDFNTYHSNVYPYITSYPPFSDLNIKTIIIGDGVQKIPNNFVSGMLELSSVTISNTVTTIGDNAFRNCRAMTGLTIPKNILRIGNHAFLNCRGITDLTIPQTLNEIGVEAFVGCSGLTSIKVENGNTSYDSRNNCNSIIQTSTNTMILGCMNSIIPNSVNVIGAKAFEGCVGLLRINIPNSVYIIGHAAFYGCTGLTSITIPESVYEIDALAFAGCKLKNITCLREYPPRIIDKDSNAHYTYGSFDDWIINNTLLCVPENSIQEYMNAAHWSDFIHIKAGTNGMDYSVKLTSDVGPTSCKIKASLTGSSQVNDVYILLYGGSEYHGEQFNGNNLIGLDPQSSYSSFLVQETTTGKIYNRFSFTTPALSMTAKAADMITNRDARLMAETNMADEETSCGFEWRRYDAPAEMPSTKVYCPVYGGTMAGTLKNLSENVYYKYRPFYKSSKGNEYYGDWIAFITADAGVEFEPVVYTYSSPEVSQIEATLQGVALRGSDDITEQGFEYWQTGQNNMLTASNVKKVTAKGERMSATVTGLQPGTAYKFRAYAIAGGKTTRGAEVDFVTESTGLDVNADGVVNIADMNVIINVILRGNNDRTCDVNGDGLVNISDLNAIISAILAN